ncbi:uncharacterized protein SAPINGB_P005599 [Magnusiomyces paraingens]|uniref:Letm1 RBD domain-containing protein n=1 Tax=Magnusiomyces paraingens TaxID=2606893 RepID=A0A5E8C2K7_9ASCO|nr:uncharacterized protein SAPINGB_P005599 [Saprochaete ingens]VVT57230.1 unnamed protein product [Saprochaete ingens]
MIRILAKQPILTQTESRALGRSSAIALTASSSSSSSSTISYSRSYSSTTQSQLSQLNPSNHPVSLLFQSTIGATALRTNRIDLLRPLLASNARFNSSKPSPSKPTAEAKPTETAVASPAQTTPDTTTPPAPEKKLTIWEKVKHEAQHYWDGTKLLGYEIKVSTKLVAKMAAGYELTRREDRQLQRTLQDITRLVPFAMFVIIPFAELLLPVALKLFPNLLPSTYESIKDKEAKTKKLRKTRDNVSTFLRKTLSESGMRLPDTVTPEEREKFALFFHKIHSSVETPSNELVVSVARLFKDDLVLDNLSRPQLIAMTRYMNMQAVGTNVIIRYQIRYRMRQIMRDDRAIDYEGVESLTVPELQSAAASRGIKTYGVSPARLRDDLRTWLDLRLRQRVPPTLLVLSSAFNYGEADTVETYYDALRAVLSALPEEVFHEAELDISSDAATHKQRLEVIKEQQELIKDENQQQQDSGSIVGVKDNLSLDEEQNAAAASAAAAAAAAAEPTTEAPKAETEAPKAETEAPKAEAPKATIEEKSK